jgi:hypothetical protein
MSTLHVRINRFSEKASMVLRFRACMSVAPHERDAQQDATNERTPHMARKTTNRSASSTDATTNATTASAPLSGFAKGAPALTLADLAARYLTHMAEQGKSEGTRFSYGMELKLAQAELGSDALVSYLTPESIALFNEAPRVTTLKSGRPKSQLSIDKTRRVLRLALTWAHQEGLIDHAVVDPKKDALRADAEGKGAKGKRAASKDAKGKRAKDAKDAPASGSPPRTSPRRSAAASAARRSRRRDEFANTCPDCVKTAEQEAALDAQPTTTDAQQDAPSEQPIATEEPAAKRAPRASKKRRGAITLEVSQVEAEAAARDAEQQIAVEQQVAVASVPQEEASVAQ